LKVQGKLRPDSLALSIVNFSELPDVTERMVAEEIATFFIAG
jgi:hypothetical protein